MAGCSVNGAAEAAVLGTPSIRFNDFVGRLSYLNELEEEHELTVGIKTDQVDKLLSSVQEFAANGELKKQITGKKDVMLDKMQDVNEFFSKNISETAR